MDEQTKAVEVFYSYAHEDEALLESLKSHLSILRREGLITEWYDRQIVAGTAWAHVIDEHINTASIILLLISSDFIASDYCYGIEMVQAMQRHRAGEARVIPIILRPTDWTSAPFAELQALPANGKAVTTWPNLDEAFVAVVQGVRRAIEDFHISRLRQDPTRFPNGSIRYFMPLKEYLHSTARRFPTERDFEQDLVYLSETYAARIRGLLRERQRTLLVGPSAAGKTVLALALARRLEEQEHFQVVYKDVGQQVREGDGRIWHELMHAHDRERVLYILDDCHLALEEVNEFCFQWEGQPPQHAQCLLISRPDTGRNGASEAANSYFEICAHEKVTIRPVDLYWGMIEKYAQAYQRQHPGRYTALEDDSAERLKMQHAHNLVVSRSRLEAWRTIGGRLSEVKQDAVYRVLIDKYLLTAAHSLPVLCALRQFEIRAHNSFVEKKLPANEIEQLARQRLLTRSQGVFYDLALHPALARELFDAYIYRQEGSASANRVMSGMINALETYLKATPPDYMTPPNYMAVYDSLTRQGQWLILEQLLTNRVLQDGVADRFSAGNATDAIRYIYKVAKYDAMRARELLGLLVQAVEPRDISAQIVGRPVQDIVSMLQNLRQIQAEMAREVVDAIDMSQLARRSERRSLQPLVSLLRVLKRISPAQAKALLDTIPLSVLAAKVSVGNMSSIEQFIGSLQELGYPISYIERFFHSLDLAALVQRSQRESLQRLYWLLRTLSKISSPMAEAYLDALTPAGLASLCRLKEADIADIGQFRKISSKPFWRQFLRQFSAQEFAVICNRSPLGEIGTFLQYAYFSFTSGYALFEEQFLAARLMQEPLDEIGKFVHRVQRIPSSGSGHPAPGNVLATNLLDKLVDVDLSGRIAHNDLQSFALLLHHAQAIDVSYVARLLTPLTRPEIVQAAFQHSSMNSIQMLLHNLSSMRDRSQRAIQSIGQALQNINLDAQLASATLREIGLFLWNVYAGIDSSLAQTICQAVDGQVTAQQLERASLVDLCFLLWNIVSISNAPDLRVLDNPVIAKRLSAAWTEQAGLGAVLGGIISFTRPSIVTDLSLQRGSEQVREEQLVSWFTTSDEGQNPYMLALAWRGLIIFDEETAQMIARTRLPVESMWRLLLNAKPSAITPRSILLMDETIAWLGRLVSEDM
jgi:energy-coupling factor transporter ATP-binding protein EcfA2